MSSAIRGRSASGSTTARTRVANSELPARVAYSPPPTTGVSKIVSSTMPLRLTPSVTDSSAT
jgi:hypothetical protein